VYANFPKSDSPSYNFQVNWNSWKKAFWIGMKIATGQWIHQRIEEDIQRTSNGLVVTKLGCLLDVYEESIDLLLPGNGNGSKSSFR